ncbi:MAG: hypothetical protein M3512_10360 [Bacteroidota bacterium]|nr:hypothetical protein [Bacteroidota bacterium]
MKTSFNYSPVSGLLLIGLVICLAITQMRCESGHGPEELEKAVSASVETGRNCGRKNEVFKQLHSPAEGCFFNKIVEYPTILIKGR